MNEILVAILAVLSWVAPQPRHSEGLLVIYGGQSLVEANAHYHGYSLEPYDGCGLAAISPAMLGQIAWVRLEGYGWIGPCLAVDVVARRDAYGSIYERHEVAEISRATAHALGYDNGGRWGYVWWGGCPNDDWEPPQLYAPELHWDVPPYDGNPAFYPYPAQELPVNCERRIGLE